MQRDTYTRTNIYVKKRETQSKKREETKNEDKYLRNNNVTHCNSLSSTLHRAKFSVLIGMEIVPVDAGRTKPARY